MSRRAELAMLLPKIVEASAAPIHLSNIYAQVEQDRPDLVDDELAPGPSRVVRWKHELRSELETQVVAGRIRRRKDLGRGMYSL